MNYIFKQIETQIKRTNEYSKSEELLSPTSLDYELFRTSSDSLHDCSPTPLLAEDPAFKKTKL